MLKRAILLLLITTPALAEDCYRGGRLCDCASHLCEGDNASTFQCPARWLVRRDHKMVCDIPGGVALIAQPGPPDKPTRR